MSSKSFKDEHPFDKRKSEADKIRHKYQDRIPVIVERNAKERNIEEIDKKKYLVPGELTVSQFMYVVKKRIKIGPEHALYCFVKDSKTGKDVLPASSSTMAVVYQQHKDEDCFLYLTYAGEAQFGAWLTIR